jgi:hypothetical protein
MKRESHDMPAERARQFDLIAVASDKTLQWARERGIALEHIEPVVPFVETDFSLEAWLFLDTEDHIQSYHSDGTAEDVVAKFRAELTMAGYPDEWAPLVACHFGSKELVDREYRGSYYLFLR